MKMRLKKVTDSNKLALVLLSKQLYPLVSTVPIGTMIAPTSTEIYVMEKKATTYLLLP